MAKRGRIKSGLGLLLGNAGESYVVAELLRRDIIANLAPRNAPGIDVLATTGSASANVRVKTRSEDADSWVWMASKEDGTIFKRLHHERDFTVLVHIAADGSPPRYWIMPTTALDKQVRADFSGWLARPGRGGKPHDPNSRMRRFGHTPEHRTWLAQYEGRWDLILTALGVTGSGAERVRAKGLRGPS
jgi:hypothetical protein